jgi:hypothetical protein
VPFARLDSILLLVKNHLKGRIPDMLNAKDNQIFLDYLAGGQSRQIAVECAANAQSKGVLSVAARNIEGLPEEGGDMDAAVVPAVMTGEHLALIKDARQELEAVQVIAKDVGRLPGNLQEVKRSYSEFLEVKVSCNQKEHEQKLHHAEEMLAFELKKQEQLQALELKKQEQLQAFEVKKQEQLQAFEVKKRKQNLDMDEEEAKSAELCRAIREGRPLSPPPISPVGPMERNKRSRGSTWWMDDEEPEDEEHEDVISVGDEDEDLLQDNMFDEPGIEYDDAAEAGMDEEAVQQRRLLWKQLEAMGAENQVIWQALADELVVTPAMAAYERQLRDRLEKYIAMQDAEEGTANSQRRQYLSRVSNCMPVMYCVYQQQN